MLAHRFLISTRRVTLTSLVGCPLISSRGIKYWGNRYHQLKPYVENQDKDTSEINSIYLEDYLDVKVNHNDELTYVDAVPIETGRETKVVETNTDHLDPCALCRLNLHSIRYTDVMILSQFIKKDGSLVTYHESKLCTKQYLKISRLIRDAQRCNLIQRPADYLVPGPWHNLNTYLERDRKRDQPRAIIKKEYWRTGSN